MKIKIVFINDYLTHLRRAMNKNLTRSLIFAITTVIFSAILSAQTNVDFKNLNVKIPTDPSILIGTLPNGMKYYIKENKKPENRAELMLATKVGSVLEEDSQDGLAHFCEHMAFNGTRNFPKSDLVNYLESIGVKFGGDLNAFTSFEQTVYTLQLPMDNKEQFNKGFQVLQDWASAVSYDPQEIDKERGVILEEWRLGKGADDRVSKKHQKFLFYNSRFAERDVIGDTNVLLHAPYERLTSFYKDWYRPNLMAIIIVGDFNKLDIEKKIIETFSGLKNPDNPRERTKYTMPLHKETFVSIATDKELAMPNVGMFFKMPFRPVGDYLDYKKTLTSQLFSTMLNNRLKELTRKSNSPFMFAFSNEGSFLGDTRVFMLISVPKSDNIKAGYETLFTEAFRVQKNGFLKSEFDRAKVEILRNMEKAVAEKEKTESKRYTNEFMNNFLENEPIPGISNEQEITNHFLPEITLEEVNALSKEYIKKESAVITLSAPEKAEVIVPNEKEILAAFDNISAQNIPQYVDQVSDSPLMSKKLSPGKIVSEKKIAEIGVTELILSNGVKVVYKPTDFKNDEVQFTSFSPGGSSLVSDKDFINSEITSQVINNSGIGNMNADKLEKLLNGKIVRVAPYISDLNEGIRGNCSPNDMETMFQLIYLYFNEARVDNEAAKSTIENLKSQIENASNSPEEVFSDSVEYISANYHPRKKPWTLETLKQIDPDKIYDIYYDRFADASDFTFLFVGNIDEAKFKTMVTTYLANLPNKNRKENWKDLNINYPKGQISKSVKKGIEKKSSVRLVFAGNFDWNIKTNYNISSAMSMLNVRLREVLREDKGGVYGVGAYPILIKTPKQEYKINVMFGCNPDRVDELIQAVVDQMKIMQDSLPTDKYMTKVKETQKREYEVNLKDNRFWLNNVLNLAYTNEIDPKFVLERPKWVEALSPQDIQNTAKKYFKTDNYLKFVLYPEK